MPIKFGIPFLGTKFFKNLFISYCSSLRSDCQCDPKQTGVNLSKNPNNVMPSANLQPVDQIRRGSAGVVGSMKLLNSFQEMHAPYTQVFVQHLYSIYHSSTQMQHSSVLNKSYLVFDF